MTLGEGAVYARLMRDIFCESSTHSSRAKRKERKKKPRRDEEEEKKKREKKCPRILPVVLPSGRGETARKRALLFPGEIGVRFCRCNYISELSGGTYTCAMAGGRGGACRVTVVGMAMDDQTKKGIVYFGSFVVKGIENLGPVCASGGCSTKEGHGIMGSW
ncbi:hypothetical protein LZ32DRAFT_241855 [Colletotrichum eremochloae]|nr:hypothetical protein LZ32DRAFT_241855 [Colletotrichum eremochloae]